MGYETRLSRKSGDAITPEEFAEWVEADPELNMSRPPIEATMENELGVTVFSLESGAVTVWKADDEAFQKLCAFADKLCLCLVEHELDDPGEPSYESGPWQPEEPPKASGEPRDYSLRERFNVGDTIRHPKFGLGEVRSATGAKVEVEFPDGVRSLIHGR